MGERDERRGQRREGEEEEETTRRTHWLTPPIRMIGAMPVRSMRLCLIEKGVVSPLLRPERAKEGRRVPKSRTYFCRSVELNLFGSSLVPQNSVQ